MNSSSDGRARRPSARAKSAMNMTAPLSTPTSRTTVHGRVVRRDLLRQFLDLVADLLLGDDHAFDVGVVPVALAHAPSLPHRRIRRARLLSA